jgi:hypothetical protein
MLVIGDPEIIRYDLPVMEAQDGVRGIRTARGLVFPVSVTTVRAMNKTRTA